MTVSALDLTEVEIQRFKSHFDVGGQDSCWPWKTRIIKGYGDFKLRGKLIKATRLSWSLHNRKPFPEDKLACHTCDNPICVNPHHIWPGTKSENAVDAVVKGRVVLPTQAAAEKRRNQQFCKNGHPLFGDNLLIKHGGKRGCKICSHAFAKKYRDSRARLARGQRGGA